MQDVFSECVAAEDPHAVVDSLSGAKPVYRFIKRTFDIVASLLSIIILSLVFLLISAIIKLQDGGPVFYVSERVGIYGKQFKFYKFRSMRVDADKFYEDYKSFNETGGPTFKMLNDPRITKFGRFLRRSSLDELPQLFNILKGEMSFVGPRPPMLREVEEYDDYAKLRLSVKGGLTCYWQINGRSTVNFERMVKFDIQYINERSIWTDTKILVKTIPAVIKGQGAW